MVYRDETFHDTEIILDEGEYYNCTFVECALIYKGGDIVMENCKPERCGMEFEGAALKTLHFLAMNYRTAPELVEQIFEAVRQHKIFPPGHLF